jgi:gamma-glutamylputrescine oxidase
MAVNNRRGALSPSPRHVDSYYAATAVQAPTTEPFGRIRDCEVCVVGGGYTGLSAALHLARRGIRVMLLEQSLLGWGASGRNGGQVHLGMRRDQHYLEKHLGVTAAKEHWAMSLRAREHLDWLINTYAIQCDLRLGLLHADHRERYAKESREYAKFLNEEYGYSGIRAVSREEMRELLATDAYVGGSLEERGGHLHALNFALGIARAAQSHGAALHERCEVTAIEPAPGGFLLRTTSGQVTANQVILAANGYLRGLSTEVTSRVMPINNFIAVTEPFKDPAALIRKNHAVSDSRFVVYYFRMTPDGRLLFGGGENYTYKFPTDIASFVRRHILKIFPQMASVRIDYAWGGTLAITPNRMPYVRELMPGLFNASGFCGKGVVLAPYVGRIVADAIAGERDEFDVLADIHVPRFPGGAALRSPTLVAAMSLAALRDSL